MCVIHLRRHQTKKVHSEFTCSRYNDTALLTTFLHSLRLLFEFNLPATLAGIDPAAISSYTALFSPTLSQLNVYVCGALGFFFIPIWIKIKVRKCNSPQPFLPSFLCTDLTQGLIWLARPHERYTSGQWRRLVFSMHFTLLSARFFLPDSWLRLLFSFFFVLYKTLISTSEWGSQGRNDRWKIVSGTVIDSTGSLSLKYPPLKLPRETILFPE